MVLLVVNVAMVAAVPLVFVVAVLVVEWLQDFTK